MNKNNAAQYLPLIQALSEGKVIQCKQEGFNGRWLDMEQPVFNCAPEFYRVKQEIINLELTREEAEVLRFVCQRTGGQPSGPRGKMDSINYKLDKLNITATCCDLTSRNDGGFYLEKMK